MFTSPVLFFAIYKIRNPNGYGGFIEDIDYRPVPTDGEYLPEEVVGEGNCLAMTTDRRADKDDWSEEIAYHKRLNAPRRQASAAKETQGKDEDKAAESF